MRRGAPARPAADRGAGEARDHRHREGPDRRLGLPRVPAPGPLVRAPARLDRHLVPHSARLQPVREPGQRLALRRRPERDGAAGDRGHVRGRPAADHGRVRAAVRARPAAARGPEAGRDHPAGGCVVHARRARADVAALDAAARLQPPRRARPARARLRRPAGRAPDLPGRDGRPLPRPVARPLPADGLRHRRVGPRLHDPVAGTGLRLPGRDPVRGRRPPRHRGRAVHDQERRLHPRGGRRRAVEARRPPSRAPRSGARDGSSSPST